MKTINRLLLFVIALSVSTAANAAGSMLRVICDGDAIGAEVQINGKFKGECPVDIGIPEGKYRLRVVKEVDDTRERVFELDVRVADGTVKKVEAVLTTRLNAAGQKLENQRLAEERAAAAKREEERLRVEAAQREKAASIRAKFDADLTSGAIQASFRDCPDCPEMVAIPPGSFDMGSNNGDADEKPVHRVTITQAFALGKTEVTQGQWRAVMGNNPSNFTNCGDNCPVEQVSWNDAQAFIRKLNARTGKQYRLPSEAEWEYACRAGGQHRYCGSDNLVAVGWYDGNSAVKTHPVGQKQANGYGLYDMSGSVWEFVEDSYHFHYGGAPSDGTVWQGDGESPVLRGGSWSHSNGIRAAERTYTSRAHRYDDCGFRLARMLP